MCLVYSVLVKVHHMKKKKKSSVLTAREFFQRAVNSLLKLCSHCIEGHRLASIEGHLILTLDTGEKIALNILKQNLHSPSQPAEDDGTSESTQVCCLFLLGR